MTQALTPKLVGIYEDKKVYSAELLSLTDVRILFLNYGALIQDWQVPFDGERRHVIYGFDDFDSYPAHSPYFGAIVGRVANRIGKSKFELNGKEYKLVANEGSNHLHGGPRGLGKQVWDMTTVDDDNGGQALRFTITSPNGEMGYPGNLTCTTTYRLNNYRLQIELEATSDADTPVNLVQHNYFNLMGDSSDIKNHRLWVDSNEILATNIEKIPTGQIQPLNSSHLDFSKAKQLKNDDGQPLSIDNSFVLNKSRNKKKPAAELTAPDETLTLRLWTDQPSIHVYTSSGLDLEVPGLGKQLYPRFGAICLEDQNFPDAVNNFNFPSSILRSSTTYKHMCEIEIAPS